MAYEKQTWIPYDDNKTEEQNIQNGAVVTAERINHLETGLDEHDKNTIVMLLTKPIRIQ